MGEYALSKEEIHDAIEYYLVTKRPKSRPTTDQKLELLEEIVSAATAKYSNFRKYFIACTTPYKPDSAENNSVG